MNAHNFKECIQANILLLLLSNIVTLKVPCTWNYWKVEHLAIRFTIPFGKIFNRRLWVLSTVWKETHTYNLNGVHLVLLHLLDSPSRQIKNATKYTTYTVCTVQQWYCYPKAVSLSMVLWFKYYWKQERSPLFTLAERLPVNFILLI